MIRRATLLTTGILAACAAAGVSVPADACRGGTAPQLVGRNVGEVTFASPHRVVIPGSDVGPVAAGTLLVWVDEKGWITRVGCG